MKDDITHGMSLAAPIERVWATVSVPGWWILEGGLVDHRIEPDGPDAVIVHDEKWGAFRIGVTELTPPTHAEFTWRPEEGVAELRVRFSLVPTTDGGTDIEVRETGFSGLTPAQYEVNYPANLEGWVVALKALRDSVE